MIEKHGATRAGHGGLRWQGGVLVLWPFAGTPASTGAVSSPGLPPVNACHSYLWLANHSFG
ncbi:hypothetical protein D0894_04060 [Pseudomonas monteilii]|uniref:Uncharacterized protein n=1 Tax=Pseudomonas monteilii TaxID=76759 RepID=A0A399MEX8_9PSED|nr:hypothetical protein D0894_04060 [Pseudomonas monteilii]